MASGKGSEFVPRCYRCRYDITNVFSAVLKLLKMAVGMRALLDTVMQALPQVTHCHIKPDLHWPRANFLLQRNANHFIFTVIRESHFPSEAQSEIQSSH